MKADPKNIGCRCNVVGLTIVECSPKYVLLDMKPRAFMIVHSLPLQNKYLLRPAIFGGDHMLFEVDADLIIDID